MSPNVARIALFAASVASAALVGGFARVDGIAGIIAPDAQLERVATGLSFAEGPVWDGKRLLVSDVQGDTLYEIDGDTFQPIQSPTHWANGHSWDAEGALLAAEHASGEVTRRTADGEVTTLAARYDGKRLNSPNAVVTRSDGQVFFTDPPFGLAPPYGPVDRAAELDVAGVYRVDPATGEVTLLTDDLTYPNGITFSPDETLVYLSDTADQTIHVFDVTSEGDFENGRLFADLSVESQNAVIDGMKTDAEGNLYVACPAGLCFLAPDGTALGTLPVPEPATDVAWGGADHDILYVTAGSSVYAIRTEATGVGSGIK